uniref:Uncharacterized protein n=1 Tax=viral metagenome TaxID=1070528 RepID=A0A6M3X411_9ZZZZ
MITRTSFNNQLLAKIDAAMVDATRFSQHLTHKLGYPMTASTYVENRHKQPIMRVTYHRGEVGAFRFWDRHQRDITPIVLQALRRSLRRQ